MLVLSCQEDDQVPRPATLHAKLRAARAEAWEGKDPGSIRVLLNNPRWERRLLRPLELSGVGRTVGDEDEEETRAQGCQQSTQDQSKTVPY